MDVLTSFLENSSIHGLGFISHTQAFRKAFWVCVVIAGFSTALGIIHQSIVNWTEQPITTMVETFPITEIDFPTVTVCPPPNTYTNLNYDLVKAENLVYEESDGIVDEDSLEYQLIYHILQSEHKQALEFSFDETDKYKNWFNEK